MTLRESTSGLQEKKDKWVPGDIPEDKGKQGGVECQALR